MKLGKFLAGALAISALAACNNKSGGDQAATADTSTVKITQAAPPPGGSWTDVVNETSGGGYVIGNPNAPVKLLEIGSLGCPVCKKFEDEGAPHVLELVKGGKLSWEFRPYLIHGPIDMAANLIAKCNGAKTFFPLMAGLFKDQDVWMGKLQSAPQQKVEEVQNLPTNRVFVEVASLVGLQDWAAARGLPQAKSNQCLSNQQMIDREVQVTSDVNTQYPEFPGTPTFVLNGTMLTATSSWEKLKPQLEAALK